jgi:hypothetical protein
MAAERRAYQRRRDLADAASRAASTERRYRVVDGEEMAVQQPPPERVPVPGHKKRRQSSHSHVPGMPGRNRHKPTTT